jgi:hypothetical protein
LGGAEAVAVAGHRVVRGYGDAALRRLSRDRRRAVHDPWLFEAIGDPAPLAAAADRMTRTPRSDPRVR